MQPGSGFDNPFATTPTAAEPGPGLGPEPTSSEPELPESAEEPLEDSPAEEPEDAPEEDGAAESPAEEPLHGASIDLVFVDEPKGTLPPVDELGAEPEDDEIDEAAEEEIEGPYTPRTFVKRPMAVPALQFDGSLECARAIESWTEGKAAYNTTTEVLRIDNRDHGTLVVETNQWVAQDAHGEFYPIAHAIFVETYEEQLTE